MSRVILRTAAHLALVIAAIRALTAGAAEVGTLPGEFAVTQTGEATYSIPIFTPVATGGLRPNLSLDYNQRGGMQIAGQGWSLGGLSMISRCPQTIAQDGAVGEITYTSSDRYCLDGQRLQVFSGSYGASGSDYRKEIEDFTRIAASTAVQDTAPQAFTVTAPDGMRYYYGHFHNSSLGGVPGTTDYRFWALRQIQDRFDNRIRIYYTKNDTTGEFKPDYIDYTYNAGLTPQYRIDFGYETRPSSDQRSGYLGGAPWLQDDRLKTITITNNSVEVYKYTLLYQTDSETGRSQLTSVQQCRGTTCLTASTFQWQDGTQSWATASSTTASETGYQYARRGDFNGDGLQDLFVPQSGELRILKSTGTSFTNIDSNKSYTSGEVIEFNGDGLSDVIFQGGDGDFHVYESTGNDTGTIVIDRDTNIPYAASFYADYNGDGLDDILIKNGTNGWKIRLATGTGFGALSSSNVLDTCGGQYTIGLIQATRIDFNNDGRDDIVAFCWYNDPDSALYDEWYARAYVATATGYVSYGNCYEGEDLNRVVPMDINGDGLTDLACHDSNSSIKWYTKLSTGNGLATATMLGSLTGIYDLVVADYDGDGRQDLLGPTSTSGWYVYKSTGTTLATTPISIGGSTDGTDDYLIAMDMTGDGYEDLVYRESSYWQLREHNSDYADVVTKFTDGLDNYFEPTYAPISTSSAYSKLSTPAPALAPPQVRYLAAPLYVVETQTASDGSGSSSTIDYTYRDALIDMQGRGFLGFYQRWVYDYRGGTRRTRYYYNQSFPYIGRLEGDRMYQASNTFIYRRNPVWANDTLSGGRRFVYLDYIDTKQYEMGGTYNGQLITDRRDDYTFENTKGQLTKVVTTTSSPYYTGTFTRTTDLSYSTSGWCYDLITNVSVTASAPSATTYTRETDRTVDTVDCVVLTETDKSVSDLDYNLETTFTYDSYGNVKTITEDSANGAAADRQTEFFYDSVGQFPTSQSFYISGQPTQTISRTFDYKLGLPLTETDVGGLQTTFTYDIFGRRTGITRPDNTTSTTDYTACSTCWVSTAKYFATENESDGGWKTTHYDSFGRPVGIRTKLPDAAESRELFVYDARGQMTSRRLPYLDGETYYSATYAYDLIGRLSQKDLPVSESQGSGSITSYAFDGLVTTVTNPLSQTTTYDHDPIGQIVSVTDNLYSTTNYAYDAFGLLKTVTDPALNSTSISYNQRGDKVSMSDPDTGTTSYDYNVFGELTNQTNAKSQTTTFNYDQLGRLTSRVDPEGTTSYGYYVSTDYKLGLVANVAYGSYAESYTYDTLRRPTQTSTTISGNNYLTNFAYLASGTNQGKLQRITYPTSTSSYRLKVDYDYEYGHLWQVKNGDTPSLVYYELNETDALGRERNATLGNGLVEARDYDDANRFLKTIQAGPSGGNSIQNLSFGWDQLGNLTQRTDVNQSSLTESFTYDGLNRLTQAQVSGQTAINIAYDAIGNITSKSDVGSYTYGAGSAGPHAVTSITGTRPGTYAYDANGNMTSRAGKSITWRSYNKPAQINYGSSDYAAFSYGPDRSRYQQVAVTGGATTTTYYIGSLFEREIAGGVTTYRHNIVAAGQTVAIYSRPSSGSNTLRYVHRDHQSTVVALTNDTGTVSIQQALSFDAFGKRRNTNWTADPSDTQFGVSHLTERGYTGHEHLDNVRLVHMNGRVQDPITGRFLSADPYVQAPYNGQSLNRYSYVWNNPGTFIDPSGFCHTIDHDCTDIDEEIYDPWDWEDRFPTMPIRVGPPVLPRADTGSFNDRNRLRGLPQLDSKALDAEYWVIGPDFADGIGIPDLIKEQMRRAVDAWDRGRLDSVESLRELNRALEEARLYHGTEEQFAAFEGRFKISPKAITSGSDIYLPPGRGATLGTLGHEVRHVGHYQTIPDFDQKNENFYRRALEQDLSMRAAYEVNPYERQANRFGRSVSDAPEEVPP